MWVTISVNHILHSCWKSHNAWAWLDADQSIVGRGNAVSTMCGCQKIENSTTYWMWHWRWRVWYSQAVTIRCDIGGGECDTLRQSQSDVTLEVESVILSSSHNQVIRKWNTVEMCCFRPQSRCHCHWSIVTPQHAQLVVYQSPAATMYYNGICVDHK